MALFGGSLAVEWATKVQHCREDFGAEDMITRCKPQSKLNKSKILQQEKAGGKHARASDCTPNVKVSKMSKSKKAENTTVTSATQSEPADTCETANADMSLNDDRETVQFMDMRGHTIFRYTDRARISKNDKRRNAKLASLAYIQNNNVRTEFKNKTLREKQKRQRQLECETYFEKDPFLNAQMMRQNFVIDRSKRDSTEIKDKAQIGKLARNNLQFIKEILEPQHADIKKNFLTDKVRFMRRLRFSIGAPNKRRQKNYKEFQQMMKNKEELFAQKKELFISRGLRVQNKVNDKVMFSKYGRKRIWNAGQTKVKRGKARRAGNVEYEIGRNVNDV